jgi:hypothetical protein
MSQNKNQSTWPIVLSAGVSFPLDVDGNMFHVLEASSKISLSFDDNNRFSNLSGGAGATFGGDYKRVTITSVVSQSIIVVLGYGLFSNSQPTITGDISASIEVANNSPAQIDVSLPAGVTTQVLTANVNRKSLTFTAGEDNISNLRVGFNNSINANQGAILAPGGSGEFATQTGFWIYNPSAEIETINIIELEKV